MWDFSMLKPGKSWENQDELVSPWAWVMGRREGKLWVRMVYYNPLQGAGTVTTVESSAGEAKRQCPLATVVPRA